MRLVGIVCFVVACLTIGCQFVVLLHLTHQKKYTQQQQQEYDLGVPGRAAVLADNITTASSSSAAKVAAGGKTAKRETPRSLPWQKQQQQGQQQQARRHELPVEEGGIVPTRETTKERLRKLPKWVVEYFEWHRRERVKFTEENWRRRGNNRSGIDNAGQDPPPKLLVLQCLIRNQKCGGTADRLKPVPLMLLAASRSRRLFFIHWTRPYGLEEFLIPPHNGTLSLDWTLPHWFARVMSGGDGDKGDGGSRGIVVSKVHVGNVDQVLPKTMKSDQYDVVTALIQWHDGGELVYNDALVQGKQQQQQQQQEKQKKTRNEFRSIYHDLFRVMFVPSPPVSRLIQDVMWEKGLVPGQYSVAQYRAYYRERLDPPSIRDQRNMGLNAVNCASVLRPGNPVYFASDSQHAVDAVRRYAHLHHRNIVVNDNYVDKNHNTNASINSDSSVEILHLDRAAASDSVFSHNSSNDRGTKRPVEDYYPIFLDLFLMGNGRCMSFGEGGFARFGLLLSYNYTCESRHYYRKRIIPCQWTDPS